MAKMSKKARSAAGKKAARTRKRNEAKKKNTRKRRRTTTKKAPTRRRRRPTKNSPGKTMKPIVHAAIGGGAALGVGIVANKLMDPGLAQDAVAVGVPAVGGVGLMKVKKGKFAWMGAGALGVAAATLVAKLVPGMNPPRRTYTRNPPAAIPVPQRTSRNNIRAALQARAAAA